MAKKKRIGTIVEGAAKDPAVRAVAAGTAVAGSAIAGKLVHDRVERAHRQAERRYRLGPDEAPEQGIKRVVAGQLDYAIELLGSAQSGQYAEAVHEARKALKRCRAALRLSRHLLGDERYRRENRALRDGGRGLSDARDSQVLLETLDGLAPPGHFGPLHDELAAQARAGSDEGRAKGQGKGQGKDQESVLPQLRQARARVDTWSLDEGGSLGPGLEQTYRRGRRALRAAREDRSVENLHELRKRAKDLWHAAELLGESRPKRAKKVARRAHTLSDLLGEDHDLAILEQRAANQTGLLEPAERELLQRLIDRRRRRLCRQALSCGARLYRRKPAKLRRRLEVR